MKVMHVQKVSGIGGSERHLLTLLSTLVERGFDVKMLVLASGEFRRFVKQMERRGVVAATITAGPDLNLPIVARIAREIRRFRPDVVHTHLLHGDVYGQMAARLAGVPAVSSVHGTLPIYRREPYRSVARFAGHLARRTIAISEHVRDFIRELRLARDDRVRITHYGIDASRWVISERERESARTDLGLGPEDVAVGVASRLVAHKGHDFLLKAMTEAVTKVPQMRLLIAGGGPLREQLESYARRYLPEGAVHFLGYVEDVRTFMNVCEAVVFPSLPSFGEGFGLAALEAMAAGRPVVASAVDSLPEIVVDGETGFLVRPGEVNELADKLVLLAEDSSLRRLLGTRGRERSSTAFTLEAMVEKTIAVYSEVV